MLASPVPLDALVAMRLNAVVVDLAVLGPQGWTYLDKLCARLPGLGVIVCTGQSSVAQRVRGLRLGADDWVTKPCHPEELIARIEAVVRRRKRADVRVEKGPVVIGEVEIRADQFQAFVSGASVELTRREFELIQLLAEAEGQVLQREEIYQRVWGYAMVHGDRSVDVFVRKLRSKLERVSPSWRYIHTHFGIGYRFSAEPVEAPVGESVRGPGARAGAGAGAARSSSPPTNLGSGVRGPLQERTQLRDRDAARGRRLEGPGRRHSGGHDLEHPDRRVRGGVVLLRLPALQGAPRDDLRPRGAPARADVRRPGAGSSSRLVATRRMWDDAGALGAFLWLAMLGAAGWAMYSVWRAYKTY